MSVAIQHEPNVLPQVVPLEALRIWRVASRDATRMSSLNAVLFERDERTGAVTAVATDGHRLIAVPCPEMQLPATHESVLVPAEFVRKLEAAAKKGAKSGASMLFAAIDQPTRGPARYTFRNVATGEEMTCERTGGSFPEWRKVVPTTAPNAVVALNAEYLAEIVAAITPSKGNACAYLRLTLDMDETTPNTLEPIRIEMTDMAAGTIVLLMPCR